MIDWWTALTIGFLGSFHCAGMCGPIAVATTNGVGLYRAQIFYNLGRVFTYSLLGALLGTFGRGFQLVGWQQFVSIAFGALLIVMVVVPVSWRYKWQSRWAPTSSVSSLKRYFQFFLKSRTAPSRFAVGVLNGLLPCGLVYLALVGAINTRNWQYGAFYMLFFGLGTIPIMLLVVSGLSQIKPIWNQRMRKGVPVFVFLMGTILVLRGLELDIPYLSPVLNWGKEGIVNCF